MEKSLGKRIMENRKRKGLTQEQLAYQLGVTAQAVSKWENDQSCPDIGTLPRLAEIFGITVDALLGRITEPPVHEAEFVEKPENDAGESEGVHLQKGSWEFQWDGGKKTAVFSALGVLLVGCLTLASRILHWDVGFWDILWPSVLLMLGVSGLLERFTFFSCGCTLLGAYFLLSNLNVLSFSLGGDLLLPIVLVIFGISLLVDAIRKKPKGKKVHFSRKDGQAEKASQSAQHSAECSIGEDTFQCSTAFGEDKLDIPLSRLSRGEATVSFGNLTVDLTGIEVLKGNATIQANCSFGEMVFLVPSQYQVKTETQSVFAGVRMEGQPDANPRGSILLMATTNFGEVTIRYV